MRKINIITGSRGIALLMAAFHKEVTGKETTVEELMEVGNKLKENPYYFSHLGINPVTSHKEE